MSNSERSIRTDGGELRLDVQMSWWGMSGLAGAEMLSTEDKVRQIAEAGFDGISGFLPAPAESEVWRDLLDRYGLSFSLNAYPRSAADMEAFLKDGKAFGRASYVNAQVLTPFRTGEAAEKLLADIGELSRASGIPVYVETHRGTITQDLMRTVRYIEALPSLELTIDYSHYVVAGELHTVSEEAESWLQRLLPRTRSIHARVSNGEQVQVAIGDEGEHPMLPHFKRWWRDGMRRYLASGTSAAAQPLSFVCELGPPSYAITADEHAGRREELSDRWRQSLLLKDIARELWREAAAESASVRG